MNQEGGCNICGHLKGRAGRKVNWHNQTCPQVDDPANYELAATYNGPNSPSDLPVVEEDKNLKHFGSLLTPKSSLIFKRDDIVNIPSSSDKPSYQIVATGRFAFHKKSLFFSFYLSNALNQMPPRPKSIQFINYRGDLLEEQTLISSDYQNATGKICGVWRRIPKEYKRLLRDEALYVALLWGNDLALSGRIARFKALYSEHLTALMTPPSSSIVPPEGGGTAIVSLSSLAATNTIHLALVFNGVFAPSDIADVPLTVRLETTDKSVHEETIRIAKPSTELNFAEVRFTVTGSDLRQLQRGKTSLSISSKTHPDLMYVRGPIMTRATCEIFQAPLSPSSEHDQQSTTVGEGSGLSWMYVTKDGSLAYSWKTDRVNGETSVALTLGKGGKIIQPLNGTTSNQNAATGLIEKLPPRTLEMLYAGELSVEATGANSIVRGDLVSRPVAEAVDSPRPVLLTSASKPAKEIVGMAWMSVEIDCDLHYEVQLTGVHETSSFQLYLEDTPLIAPNAPVSRRWLEDFNGTTLEGFAQLTSQELSRMDSGICFLEILDRDSGRILLRANMKPLKIPSECLASPSDNDVPSILSISSSNVNGEAKCLHDGVFYDEGVQWRHKRDPCRMCHCMRGKEKCDDVTCPALSCSFPVRNNKDQCCSSCLNNTIDDNTKGCNMAGVFYAAGSSWHPYLPPHGFNLCTVITCDANTLAIKFSRIQCPVLTCPEAQQVRVDKSACCKVCSTQEVFPRDQPVPTESNARSDDEIMKDGGCKYVGKGPYENNSSWIHTIPSVGPTPCVRCHCKNGIVTCERKKCPRTECSNSTAQLLKSGLDECCSSQCRRYRRQSRHKKGGKKNTKV